MLTTSPDRVTAVYNESNRALQAIAAEYRDYSLRFATDSQTTFLQMSKAGSLPEAMELLSAFSKRAIEESVQQMTRIANMYATAAGDQTRAVQALMLPLRG